MHMFKNIEFCNSNCANICCYRFITKEIVKESKKSVYLFYTADFSPFCDRYSKQPDFQRAYITGELKMSNVEELIEYCSKKTYKIKIIIENDLSEIIIINRGENIFQLCGYVSIEIIAGRILEDMSLLLKKEK